MKKQDREEFRGFCRNASDRGVVGIWEKETGAGRLDYAEIAEAEAERRGIDLPKRRNRS